MKVTIFWFRRDLRLEDNAGLFHALKTKGNVLPIFIFDKNILDKLESNLDARVTFLYERIHQLKLQLQALDSDLKVFYGYPQEVYKQLLQKYEIAAVYTNRDYESYARTRDDSIKSLLKDIPFRTFKDHVIFEADEVTKDNGDPYVVFTPFKRKWIATINSRGEGDLSYYLKSYPSSKYVDNFARIKKDNLLQIEDMGFHKSPIAIPKNAVSSKLIKEYDKKRNFPAIKGTSKLGIHFRFGTISIREKARKAWSLNETFLSELIWRDFYSSILQVYPKVENESFRSKYDSIEWRNNEQEFNAWCEGKTGYPMVDAGMRELNTSGYMHNRVRMVVASFLTKHLLIDWRWGEAYFAEKLLDYDLASNNGGWQWAAGSGTDAAPYFRIFNPASQLSKFDKDLKYVKQYVPEYGTDQYPDPIVNHKEARERCLATYKAALN